MRANKPNEPNKPNGTNCPNGLTIIMKIALVQYQCNLLCLAWIHDVAKVFLLAASGGCVSHAGGWVAFVRAGGVVDGDTGQHTGRDSLGHTASAAQLVKL